MAISKLACLADAYAKWLQTKETLNMQIADTIQPVLKLKVVVVVIDAKR
ncbi:MAG: GTP cyclohydrolase I [Bacteroidota bacterium]